MTQATDGLLVYGYDLGGLGEWKIQEGGEQDELALLDRYDEDEDRNFTSAAERRVLATVAVFTELWTRGVGSAGYFERGKPAEARVVVEI
ncbi:hypothetical protein [Streptomyces sp. NPDC088246]|uniref:hypothetical protein n=1 Tax=Streptomyces sp. NPDC088246 TaxID=3365842 RepID=UPI003824F982